MVLRGIRYLRSFFLWRWWVCLLFSLKGVRVHPAANLNGTVKSFRLKKGTKIGARNRLTSIRGGLIISGNDVWTAQDVEIETGTRVYIGDGTTIQRRCTINGSVHIGLGCIFAPNVFISSGTHPFRERPWLSIREQERAIIDSKGSLVSLDRPICIQDDCWLGTNVVVCPGVTIGKGSIVGANAVVVMDVPPYSVVAGIPAKTIGRRLEWSPPKVVDCGRDEDQPYVVGGIRKPKGADPAGIGLTNGSSFEAVLSIEDSITCVLVELYASASGMVTIMGVAQNVIEGRNMLRVPIDRKSVVDGKLNCKLTVDESWIKACVTVSQVKGE